MKRRAAKPVFSVDGAIDMMGDVLTAQGPLVVFLAVAGAVVFVQFLLAFSPF